MSADLELLIDELYALPLERFVPERGVLARQLRGEGRRAEAAQVAALDKPAIAGWAVNQVVRAQRDASAALWDAGDAVLAVQADVVGGRASGAELREALEAERRALNPLADAARGLMTGSGRFLAEPHVQAVVETLHAAAIDPSAREPVAAARVVKPLRLTGLEAALTGGGGAGGGGASPPRRDAPPAKEAGDGPAADRRRDERAARAAGQEARRALQRAERARDEARRRVTDAAAQRDEAAAIAERARSETAAAEQALAAAESRLTTAHAELEHAEDAADRARGDAADA